jgi:hypothetical protein
MRRGARLFSLYHPSADPMQAGNGRPPLVDRRRYYRLVNYIEDFFLRPAVKKAIIILLQHTDIKVLKDALAC